MKSITILDFSTGEVHIFPYFDYIGEEFNDISNYLNYRYDIHFREEDCQWMIGDLKLTIHGE